jgi:hypothetical protein
MVLRLLRDLPGVPGLLATIAREFLHELDPSVGGPGPHDFAVRFGIARLTMLSRPSHPAANVHDDRDTPLLWSRTGRTIASIAFLKREIFLRTGIDTISENQHVGQISRRWIAQRPLSEGVRRGSTSDGGSEPIHRQSRL